MKLLLAFLMLVFITACSRKTETQKLEAGYRASAAELNAALARELADPATVSAVIGRYQTAVDRLNALGKRIDAIGQKSDAPPSSSQSLTGISIASVSEMPPELSREEHDLYGPFNSSVSVRLRLMSGDASFNDRKTVAISFPVKAGIDHQWKFPTADEVLGKVKEACDKSAEVIGGAAVSEMEKGVATMEGSH